MRQYEFYDMSAMLNADGWEMTRTTKDSNIFAKPGVHCEVSVPKKSICILWAS